MLLYVDDADAAGPQAASPDVGEAPGEQKKDPPSHQVVLAVLRRDEVTVRELANIFPGYLRDEALIIETFCAWLLATQAVPDKAEVKGDLAAAMLARVIGVDNAVFGVGTFLYSMGGAIKKLGVVDHVRAAYLAAEPGSPEEQTFDDFWAFVSDEPLPERPAKEPSVAVEGEHPAADEDVDPRRPIPPHTDASVLVTGHLPPDEPRAQ
ncbi:MAG: hypothetical protein A3J48_03470 [Candidatus Doudnabacteria bacterium RIFCSPHIGHO2_02_FULL_46_11]|uniref:Uncharacterized protein n=1 Tax=Candidatus Doudnabacteria bacterium RIFCSPHIGHO2_02_FULL_46_11 TaxID=1817832 RepID=A0A1F5P4R6_9BACT|nr:MAG: hypothetical protein A3J48_03470 [Candidatus Doudnabacteria bacterium RIFCSPHIGHO2_02_FULL_46_11]